MKVYQIPVGPMQNFSYIVEDTSTHEAIVIDPSWDLEKLTKTIDEQNLKIKYIVNTHWHDDHTRGNEELSKQLGVKIIQHEASQLKNDLTVSDGDSIEFGSSFLMVYHTPGHSKDSICLLGGGKIFTGDTLFVGRTGRTVNSGADAGTLFQSVYNKLLTLPSETIIYPGHDYGSVPTISVSENIKISPLLQAENEADFISRMAAFEASRD